MICDGEVMNIDDVDKGFNGDPIGSYCKSFVKVQLQILRSASCFLYLRHNLHHGLVIELWVSKKSMNTHSPWN